MAGAAPAPPSAWGPIHHVEGAEPRALLVKGKPYVYFRVARRSPIHFTVRGPARLIVISRAELPRGSSGTVPYFIRVLGPHSPLKVQVTESSPTPDARPADGARSTLCESRRLEVPIPEGEQHVWISVSGVPGVFVRLLRRPPRANGDGMTVIAPGETSRAVTVLEGGERVPYYTVTPGKPLRFGVTGPTDLRLISRLDRRRSGTGSTPYVLRLSSGGKTLRTQRYQGTAAEGAAYVDLPDLVPSQPDTTDLPLGSGPTEVMVELVEPLDGAAQIHARVTEPAEDGEE